MKAIVLSAWAFMAAFPLRAGACRDARTSVRPPRVLSGAPPEAPGRLAEGRLHQAVLPGLPGQRHPVLRVRRQSGGRNRGQGRSLPFPQRGSPGRRREIRQYPSHAREPGFHDLGRIPGCAPAPGPRGRGGGAGPSRRPPISPSGPPRISTSRSRPTWRCGPPKTTPGSTSRRCRPVRHREPAHAARARPQGAGYPVRPHQDGQPACSPTAPISTPARSNSISAAWTSCWSLRKAPPSPTGKSWGRSACTRKPRPTTA